MVLVTGAGGWLGSELTEQLLKLGNNVKAFNNIETKRLKELKLKYAQQLEIILGDICDKDIISKSLEGIDTVYHLAAKVHYVPTNKKEEEEFFKVNTIATEDIFNECINNKVKRVIFFSTVSVYESANNIIDINSNKNPSTIYGKSKLEAEDIANRLHKEEKLPVTIIEPVTVYGEGDVGNFKKLENLIRKGLCIKFGSGKNKKTVIYYKDLIEMVINIANDDETIGKTIICGTEVLTINEINETLIKKYNKKVIRMRIPTFITNLLIKICNFSKLKKIRRKVMALTQNNEFDIEERKKYLNKIISFSKYEV